MVDVDILQENIFIFVNENGCIMNDKYTKIPRLSHGGKINFFKANETNHNIWQIFP